MKQVFQFMMRCRWVLLALGVGFTFFWTLIRVVGLPAKRVAVWTFVIVWFLHLLIAAGAGYAAWRLWPERENKFVNYSMIHLHAAILDGLGAIVLLFLAVNVRFTWKFSLVFFSFALLRDVVRVPLIFYIIRGPQAKQNGEIHATQSGELPPEVWEGKMTEANIRAIDKRIRPEFLK
jgi:hypothetical protein